VELYNGAGAYVNAVTTDATGAYSFTGLASGTYTVRVVNGTVTSARAGTCGSASIGVDAVSSGTGSGAGLTVAHTTGSGADRLMLVGVSLGTGPSRSALSPMECGA